MFKSAAYVAALFALTAKYATGFLLFGLSYLWFASKGHEGLSTVAALGIVFGIVQMAYAYATDNDVRNFIRRIVEEGERLFQQETRRLDEDR